MKVPFVHFVASLILSFSGIPNIFLSTLFLHIINLYCPNLREEFSNAYTAAGKTVVLCILVFKFLDKKQGTEDSEMSGT
jgi:hypothetical protein